MRRWLVRFVTILLGLVVLIGLAIMTAGRGWYGQLEGGEPVASLPRAPQSAASDPRPHAVVQALPQKRILFGDLHAHTTFSADAFTFSLPMTGGEGAHPPADACDFARHCAALDFWSINDHAASLTPRRWRDTVDAIRQCNAVDDDMVSFLGWEWTQAGTTPENHYGHKNVILRHTDDDRIPTRPIGAAKPAGKGAPVGRLDLLPRGALALAMGGRFHDWAAYLTELSDVTYCDTTVGVRELGPDCVELVPTPKELFARLTEWGHESIVIPHGTTWGAYTPPGSTWNKQLRGAMHDSDRQILLESYSGHGDAELFREWRAVRFGPDGSPECPEPSANYLPSCWRAGEIIFERCTSAGESTEECNRRAATARANYLAGPSGHLTVPGAKPEDWLDAGQCSDCRQPTFNHRPGSSAQYILALGDFSDSSDRPRRFRMGLIGSSDNHFARAGSGYKEVARSGMTESISRGSGGLGPLESVISPPPSDPLPYSVPYADAIAAASGFARVESERAANFLVTGGLIALHATASDRDSIWDAMQRREVYGTTGPRILLWFDLLNPPTDGGSGADATLPSRTRRTLPMGSEVALSEAPRLRVRAVGSFEQKPGCPDRPHEALGADGVERLCKGECYHPSDVRRPIDRIEIVRIRPQTRPDEDIAGLIEDPWRTFDCPNAPAGCDVEFVDEDFPSAARETLYYARAFEAPAPAINGQNLRCDRTDSGRCERIRLCPGNEGPDDECLSSHEPRAWSSPIFVKFQPALTEEISAVRARGFQRSRPRSENTPGNVLAQGGPIQ